jgi:hypothetical protein
MRQKIIGGKELLLVAYNPSAVREQDSVVTHFPDNQIRVHIWDKAQKKFKDIQHEIFCYRDQDYKVECEVHTYAEIAPL